MMAYPAETVGLADEAHRRAARLRPLTDLREALEEKNALLRHMGEPELIEEELLGGRLYTGLAD